MSGRTLVHGHRSVIRVAPGSRTGFLRSRYADSARTLCPCGEIPNECSTRVCHSGSPPMHDGHARSVEPFSAG